MSEGSVREKLRSRYNALTSREQQLTAILAIIGVFSMLYYGGVMPLHREVEKDRHAYAHEQELLEWMQSKERQLKGNGSGVGPSHPGSSMPTILTDSSKKAGISIKKMDLNPDLSATVSLGALPFDTLVKWVDSLDKEYQLTVQTLSVTKASRPGEVNVSLRIK